MEHEDITRKIIGCAYHVYNKMGFGFLESVYEKCLVIVELKAVQVVSKAHEIQLVNCLVATGVPLGLLTNFGESKCAVRRKVRKLPNRKGSTG